MVQLNALNATTPVPPGMIQPSPVVMLSDHQAIAAARAKAQAQGLLPQSLQMPLTEQIQLLSSTVPQQISVKPTSNVAELHSQLQKQLLGAEIVPVSKPVEQIPTSSVDVQRPVEIRQQPTVDISQQMASILQHQAPVSIGQHHFVGVRQQPTDVTLQSAQVVPQGSQMPPQITGHSDPAVIQPEGYVGCRVVFLYIKSCTESLTNPVGLSNSRKYQLISAQTPITVCYFVKA